MDFPEPKPSARSIRILVLYLLLFIALFHVSAQNKPTSQSVKVDSVVVSGNKKTLNNIIFRELLIASGDTLQADEFAKLVNQSRLNLLNTSLFNFVTVDTVSVSESGGTRIVNVTLTLLERWYIWPVPVLQLTDRNFNAWWLTRDFTRINYGIDLKWDNFTGRMDEFNTVFQLGKNRKFSLAYQNPYIDKKKRFGMGFSAGYTRNREVGYITTNDILVFAFDPDGLTEEKYILINGTFRNNIFVTHQLFAGLNSFSFSDSLLRLNPDYSYKDTDELHYLSIYYKFKVDRRDIKYYPLKGWYVDVELNKSGLGFGFEHPVNTDWAKTTTRLYSKLAKRWYTGVSFIGKVSSSAWQPYFLIEALGYSRDYVRGYEYNVIDGKHFALFRSNIKFALVPERAHSIGFIPAPKFGKIHYALYLTAFADGAYVWQPQRTDHDTNLLPHSLLAGTGIGIDMVTYYDKVVRVEYAVNKLGKSGIFIHFIAGI